jgi:hypothetical protein
MTEREIAVDAVEARLQDMGYLVEKSGNVLDATGPYGGGADIMTVPAVADDLLDVLIVDPPSDLNGETYLAVYSEDIEMVFFLPTDAIPDERFTLNLSSQPTKSIMEAYRFLDLT